MSELPLVSVIVPTRNEAADIEGCLAAIAAQDYPPGRLEVIVVDGSSDDGTGEIARATFHGSVFASTAVLSNPVATTPSNLNLGLEHATGEVVCRVDARTRIQPHYVRTCAEVLLTREEVAVVGGAQVALARDRRAISIGIARALNNRWSMGGSPYRRARVSGPVDTVYLGAFRRLDLVDVGGWNEKLVTNQDFDLNRRLARRGLVWFEATLRSGYLPRSTLRLLWRQYLRFGRAKVQYWRLTGERPEPRQWLLLVGPVVAVAGGAAAAGTGRSCGRSLGLLAAASLGAGAVEAKGTQEPEGGLGGHMFALVAMGVVAVGWWLGAASSAVGLSSRGAR